MPETPPGPRSKFPGQLIYSFQRDRLGFLLRAQRKYGDVVHFRVRGRPFYVFAHPDAVRDVLVTHDAKFIKGPALRNAKTTLGEGLLTSEGDFHRRQRRLTQPAFHPNRVAGYAGPMTQYAQEQADAWRDGTVVNVHEEMMQVTLRVVAKTLFDADVREEVDEIGRAMDIAVNMFTRAMSPFGPILNRLPLPSNFRFKRAYARLLATIDRFIAERHASGVDRGDLLSMLIRTHEDEYVPGDDMAMSDKQLRDECMTLFTAGHETTANALTFALHLLAHHPDVQRKLHEEIDRVLAGDRLPTREDVDRLSFTHNVIAESMRLYPAAWAIGRESKEAVEIGGYVMPAGAVVLLAPWVMHRDPRFWPDPEQFNPDRWSSESERDRPRWSYFPFGGGSRSCIGEAFAWMEAVLVLATIARHWQVEAASPRHPPLQPTITLRPKHGLAVRVTRRSSS
jgi:cytochrome P450